MKSKWFSFVLVIALLIATAAPALAASNDTATSASCRYGSIAVRDPRTYVITYRCRTYAEWLQYQLKTGMSNGVGATQRYYEGKVTQLVDRAGSNALVPPARTKPVQNTACLLKGGSNCYR